MSSGEELSEKEYEKEVVNMCFIALENHEDEVNSSTNYDQLHNSFEELYLDLEKISSLPSELDELKRNFKTCEKVKLCLEKKRIKGCV